MAFNKFMHPKNIYRKPPDFTDLAIKYPEFLAISKLDVNGSVKIDFKNVATLRALSRALLQNDFGLDVEMPLDRLIPAIPLRLNYILWLQDIFQVVNIPGDVFGIDIGCGATCVYSLLASKINNWKMLASESDKYSYRIAVKNVENNHLDGFVKVHHCEAHNMLIDLPFIPEQIYDFVMCNPPFFSSEKELSHTANARKEIRAPPRAVRTGCSQELVVPGGEVAFVVQMIKESAQLKHKIRLFSTMLGHKSSLSQVKSCLDGLGIYNIAQTRFCQGRTMRWAIAWSFQDLPLNTVPDYFAIKNKSTHSLSFVVPKPSEDYLHSIEEIKNKIEKMFSSLKLSFNTLSEEENCVTFEVIAAKNTWSHQRRLRREEQRKALESKVLSEQETISHKTALTNSLEDILSSDPEIKNEVHNIYKKRPHDDEVLSTKKIKMEPFLRMGVCLEQELIEDSDDDEIDDANVEGIGHLKNGDIILKLGYIEGLGGKDAVHQIMQYVMNNWNKITAK